MIFDDQLQIYSRVEKEYWDGIEKDTENGHCYYSDIPSGMRYYLRKKVYKMNLELAKELYELYTWSKDITENYSNEELESFLIDPTALCSEFNLEQYHIIQNYLSYWKTQVDSYPGSELPKRRMRYLQTVCGELKYWFDRNNIEIPRNQFIEKMADDSAAIELVCDKKKNVKKMVFEVLSKSDNKKVVLKELPQKEQMQNKRWKLSNEQVRIKYFSEEGNTEMIKATIIRNIKRFRSENTNESESKKSQ